MWNDQSVVGGGFFNSPSQFGNATPNQPQKTGRRSSHTAPIVIRQAVHSGDEGIKIWGTEIQIVSVVARVRNIRMQSSKITYTIQDITGRMRALQWLDQEVMDDDDQSATQIKVNDYVQIYGNVKINQGNKYLTIYKINKITDVNAITNHYLHCIHNKYKLEADFKKAKTAPENKESAKGLPSNSVTGFNDTSSVNGLNAHQMIVFNLIRNATLEQGISKQDMYIALKDRMSQMEFEKILEWMCGEGHVYSTIDEEHFRATDAF